MTLTIEGDSETRPYFVVRSGGVIHARHGMVSRSILNVGLRNSELDLWMPVGYVDFLLLQLTPILYGHYLDV